MTFRSWLCVSGLVCSAALAGCGSDSPAAPMQMAGAGGTPDLHVDNPGSAGRPAAGSGGTTSAGMAGSAAGSGGTSGAAGGGGAAGTAAAGSGGSTAGSGGSGGAGGAGGGGAGGAGGAGGTGGAGGAGGSGGAAGSDDPFADLFGPTQISCEGLLCLEDANCAEFYPDETAVCKFTKCVDFACQ